MEFSYDEGTSYQNAGSGTVSGLDAGDYYIRIKAAGANFASDPAIVTIQENIPVSTQKRDTPKAIFDARTMTLNNLPSEASYSINNGASWTDAGSSVEIRDIAAGSVIMIKALGDGSTTTDSDIQSISTSQMVSPSGIVPIPATSSTGLGGLNHVNNGMEYLPQNGSSWTSITGSTVTGLIPQTYEVRNIASGNKLASASVSITVPITAQKIKAPKPNGSFDAPSMYLNNVSVGMAYSFDGGHSFTTINDNHCTRVSLSNDNAASAIAHGGIQLKMLGDNVTTTDSDVQTVAINKANPPSNIDTKPTDHDGGAIKNVNSNMQYAKVNGNWVDINGDKVENLSRGDYYVRYRANGSTLASDSITVHIGKKTHSKQSTPTADFNAMIMTLSNVRGVKYSLDGGDNWVFVTDQDKVVLSESSLSVTKGIKLYRPSDGSSTDSDAQIITLSKADAPAALSVINATASSLGIINGVNNNMEYKPVNTDKWIEITGNTLTNLQPGNYLVRVHGRYNILPSEPVGVAVALSNGSAKQAANTTNNSSTAGNVKKEQNTGTTTDTDTEETVPSTTNDETKMDSNSDAIDPYNNSSEPVLVTNSKITGWDAITQSITPGEPLLIELHEDSPVPATLLSAAKSAGSDIVIGMNNHVQWSISAASIEDVSSDIDLTIKDSAVSVPDDLVTAAEEYGTIGREFDITHEGGFGFSAYLTLPVNTTSASDYANLLYYNPDTNALEIMDSCKVDDSGYASFHMQHASSYLVVISSAPITSLKAAEKKDMPSSTTRVKEADTTTNKTALILFVCVVVLITILLINLVLTIIGRKTNRRRKHKK